MKLYKKKSGTVDQPKSMNHWLAKRGIRVETRGGKYYWKGKGRHYRLNCYNEFEVSDLDFDRWANSVEYGEPCPQTEKEMDAFFERAQANRVNLFHEQFDKSL